MTPAPLRQYRFHTRTQVDACLFSLADRTGDGLRPFAPWGPATLVPTKGGHAPVVTPAGEILWRNDAGALYRVSPRDPDPESQPSPYGLGHASRIVATLHGLWVATDQPPTLQRFEFDTLTCLQTVDMTDMLIVDIASDGRDAVFALVECESRFAIIAIDRFGHSGAPIALSGISGAKALTSLRGRRFVVLWNDRHPRLSWISAQGERLFSVGVHGLRPCFEPGALGSDNRSRVILAGVDGAAFGGAAHVLTLDAEGELAGDVAVDPLDGAATGVVGALEELLVTTKRGLLRFGAADAVSEVGSEVRTTLVTPLLFSPDDASRRPWLRVEATATLPEGCTLEVAIAAIADGDVRGRLAAILADDSAPQRQRISRIVGEPGIWQSPTVFHGSNQSSAGTAAPFAAKLFDIGEPYVMIRVTLAAGPGAQLPELSDLSVLYPGQTLMDRLPAIYQGDSLRSPDGTNAFARALVGVLEATTQDIDARIGSMASRIHPSTALPEWLDFVARWLGLPWDDGLSLGQKRAIVSRAEELTKWRGTRGGLEALLGCLMPGSPARFRVTDATADFGFAMVGGDGCDGSRLPAMLGGFSRWSPELDSRAVLGHMRLPCAGQIDDGVGEIAGRVRVEIAATAAERKTWSPWLLSLITAMVPLTAQVHLRWVSAYALRTNRLDGTMTLEADPIPHLGTDAITGVARLPETGTRLSSTGPSITTTAR
ncbi:MAG: phage tail protein [Acidobacteriota bacterium]|nr:phage tail protein [Acidobacteriota bacterium]